MKGKSRLIDTNVLVYAYDVSEKSKHQVAKYLLNEIWDYGGGVVSLQNLSEFFVAVTSKVDSPIAIADAKTIISDILRSSRWLVIDRQAGTIIKAIEIVKNTRTPFWDTLIAAYMLEHGIETIITENERDFKKIPGIKVANPFRSSRKT